MEAEEVWSWWGLLRRRADLEEVEPTRKEVATFMLLPALLLNLIWLVVMCFIPTRLFIKGLNKSAIPTELAGAGRAP